MTHATEADFLAAIIARPGDDTPRLVFADWLEEHGHQPERAEFIRVQCELAKMPEPEELTFNPIAAQRGTDEYTRAVCVACRRLESGLCPYHTLQRRERALQAMFIRVQIALAKRPRVCPVCNRGSEDGFVLDIVCDDCERLDVLQRRERALQAIDRTKWPGAPFVSDVVLIPWAWFRRGFLAELECTALQFRGGMANVLQLEPVEKLTLRECQDWADVVYLDNDGTRQSSLREIILETNPHGRWPSGHLEWRRRWEVRMFPRIRIEWREVYGPLLERPTDH